MSEVLPPTTNYRECTKAEEHRNFLVLQERLGTAFVNVAMMVNVALSGKVLPREQVKELKLEGRLEYHMQVLRSALQWYRCPCYVDEGFCIMVMNKETYTVDAQNLPLPPDGIDPTQRIDVAYSCVDPVETD
jgi:hypothetical protein